MLSISASKTFTVHRVSIDGRAFGGGGGAVQRYLGGGDKKRGGNKLDYHHIELLLVETVPSSCAKLYITGNATAMTLPTCVKMTPTKANVTF